MERLKSLLRTKTAKHSAITFSGSMINGILGAVFFILIARDLGPAAFGIVSVSIAAATFIADVSDIGTDTGLVRFVSKYIKTEEIRAMRILKLSLELRIIIGGLAILLGVAFSPLIASTIFHKPQLTYPLQIAFIGIITAQLFSFTTSSFQALQKFSMWSGVFVITNALRLLIIYIFIVVGTLTIGNTLAVYILMPLLGFVIGIAILPTKKYLLVNNELSEIKDFFHFNKWVAAFTLVSATSSRLDTFITARLLSEEQLGIYSASNQLVQVIPQLIGALGTVIAPKMSEMTNKESFVKYYKKTQLLVIVLAVMGLIGIPVAKFLIPLLYGSAYQGSVPVFAILFISMLLFLIALPIHNGIIYYYSYPKLFFYLGIGHLLIVLIGGWYLITYFGVIGAALAVLVGMIYTFIFPAIWLYARIKNDS